MCHPMTVIIFIKIMEKNYVDNNKKDDRYSV